MSYIALYRKYRPDTFESIVGQENVTKILKNQVKLSKVSHAYIFSGSRGTGKTSAARVFARAINCLDLKDGEPCNLCSACKSILEGTTTDVVEMDAASNNSVENIRQIRQEVSYATIDTKYRVYIIDEAHMLTTSAFNALLKTLEEPPKNVIFILATTEVHKIPITILSRCIRFEFNKINIEDMVKRVKYVLEEEKFEYEDEAVEYIAKLADGAMRDALSILDRCITETSEKLTLHLVENIVGSIDNKLLDDIVISISEYNSTEAIENIDKIIKKGKDIRETAYRLSEKFLKILISMNKDKEENHNISNKRVMQIIDILAKLDADIRNSTRPEILLKASIAKMCILNSETIDSNKNVSTDKDKDSNAFASTDNINMLLQRIEKLETKLNELNQEAEKVKENNSDKNEGSKSLSSEANEDKPKEKHKKVSLKEVQEKLKLEPLKEADELKNTICLKGKISIYSALASAKVLTNENEIVIFTNTAFAYSKLTEEESLNEINNTLNEKFSIEKPVKVCLNEEAGCVASTKIEETLDSLLVDYTKID